MIDVVLHKPKKPMPSHPVASPVATNATPIATKVSPIASSNTSVRRDP